MVDLLQNTDVVSVRPKRFEERRKFPASGLKDYKECKGEEEKRKATKRIEHHVNVTEEMEDTDSGDSEALNQ